MRRLVFPIIVGVGLVMVGSSSASAEDPTPAATVSAKATPGKKLCKITDKRLTEISGIVATSKGYVVINDGTTESAKEKIFFLDRECAVDKVQDYSGEGPLDPEDLVLSADGETLWIADIGDNGVRAADPDPRPSVALWSMPAGGAKKPALHRLSYPEGDSHDAEALLLSGDGTPLIVTKEIGKPAAVYQPTAPLKARNSEAVPMKKVAEINVNATETAGNTLARIGNKTITGGAVASGGAKVALRTYTDALEWDVTGGDVIGALKKEPRTTGLPNEPFGEAISYSADGKAFLTVSDMNGDSATANNIREYTPATTVAALSEKSGKGGASDSWYSDLTVDDVTYMVAGVGALGLILVGVGVFGIMRFRKSPAAAAGADDLSTGLKTTDPETELIGVGGAPQRAAAYGGTRPGAGSGPVYGAQSGPPGGAPQRGTGVYGGSPGNGPQYGRPAAQPPRGPQQTPARGPQQPARGPQQPARGPQQPARGPQQPARGPQQAPARAPQPPPRGPQQAPGRVQQPPARGPQQQPPRGPQPPPPGRGHQPPQRGGGSYGGQQQGRGPQPPRGPQQGQAQRSPGVYGGGGRPQPGQDGYHR
ncbi:hypothetical protein [Actinoplanes aureus]|uniref:Uncharacterized protein n=1 Tax=Actinoplanes aureus TaxID=2792083 RepID=A0A931FU95_9ACTN|nr:hypothetical protein [Actinoplanes aureus]MBG0559963.1 hypothetical protein [Actinoplanes aureus]